MFISSRSYDALMIAYQKLASQLTDAQNTIHLEREAAQKERKDLLDRILALSNPMAHSMVNPRPVQDQVRLLQKPRAVYPGQMRPTLYPHPDEVAVDKAMPTLKPENHDS